MQIKLRDVLPKCGRFLMKQYVGSVSGIFIVRYYVTDTFLYLTAKLIHFYDI